MDKSQIITAVKKVFTGLPEPMVELIAEVLSEATGENTDLNLMGHICEHCGDPELLSITPKNIKGTDKPGLFCMEAVGTKPDQAVYEGIAISIDKSGRIFTVWGPQWEGILPDEVIGKAMELKSVEFDPRAFTKVNLTKAVKPVNFGMVFGTSVKGFAEKFKKR